MNTYIAIYLVAVVVDLVTTHRALSKVPTAKESHSILKLFGIKRPEWWQLLVSGVVQSSVMIWASEFLFGDHIPLMAMAGWHVYFAYRNWKLVEDRT